MCGPLIYLLPKTFKLVDFPIIWLGAYPMKVILSVPDEGYSRNASCTLNLISKFLSDQILFSDFNK